MTKTTQEILDEYVTGLTLDQLIKSHKHLRSLNLELTEEKHKAIKLAYDHAYERAMDSTWVKWDHLRTMTLQELVWRLNGD